MAKVRDKFHQIKWGFETIKHVISERIHKTIKFVTNRIGIDILQGDIRITGITININ